MVQKINRSILFLGLILLYPQSLEAQSDTLDNSGINFPEPPTIEGAYPTATLQELYLSYSVLGFGILSLIIFAILILKKSKVFDKDIFKYLTIIIIVIGSLFLVTAGYGNEQIAPIIGLLGTIAGYMLGVNTNPHEKSGM